MASSDQNRIYGSQAFVDRAPCRFVRAATERLCIHRKPDRPPERCACGADARNDRGNLFRRTAIEEHPVRVARRHRNGRIRLSTLIDRERCGRSRFEPQRIRPVIVARVTERLSGPRSAQHLDELARSRVALVVVRCVDAVHRELTQVPTAGDVDRPAPFGEAIDRGAPFGDCRGLEESGMNGGDQSDAFAVSRDECSHRQTIERRTLHFFAAAPPALCDQQMTDPEHLEPGNGASDEGAQRFTLRHSTASRRPADDLRAGESGWCPSAGQHGEG